MPCCELLARGRRSGPPPEDFPRVGSPFSSRPTCPTTRRFPRPPAQSTTRVEAGITAQSGPANPVVRSLTVEWPGHALSGMTLQSRLPVRSATAMPPGTGAEREAWRYQRRSCKLKALCDLHGRGRHNKRPALSSAAAVLRCGESLGQAAIWRPQYGNFLYLACLALGRRTNSGGGKIGGRTSPRNPL
jgi:hypothetical protein